jgi:hypothetical protein
MPEAPDDTQDQAGPERSEPALEQRQGHAPPAELLDRADEQRDGQRGQHPILGGEREWVGERALDGGT